MSGYPRRIICLTEETTETLYLLGQGDRIVEPREVARRDPEVVFASWCGKKVRKATILQRAGWENVAAVRDDRIYEIKSTYILQPGPASLTDGVRQLHDILGSIHGVGTTKTTTTITKIPKTTKDTKDTEDTKLEPS